MEIIQETGLILKVQPIGERDRRVTILTRTRGKISAFARGARKQDSPLLGVCQPFVFGVFQLIEGRTSYTCIGVEVQNSFMELREDLDKVCFGLYFCELADYFTRENLPALEVLRLLYQSLRALGKDSLHPALVRCIYELRMIASQGEAPELRHCLVCGTEEGPFSFSAAAGGVLCSKHQSQDPQSIPLGETTRYAMEVSLFSPLEKLYTFKVSPEVLAQWRQGMDRYYQRRVNHSFHSLDLLQVSKFTQVSPPGGK